MDGIIWNGLEGRMDEIMEEGTKWNNGMEGNEMLMIITPNVRRHME